MTNQVSDDNSVKKSNLRTRGVAVIFTASVFAAGCRLGMRLNDPDTVLATSEAAEREWQAEKKQLLSRTHSVTSYPLGTVIEIVGALTNSTKFATFDDTADCLHIKSINDGRAFGTVTVEGVDLPRVGSDVRYEGYVAEVVDGTPVFVVDGSWYDGE